MEELIKNIILNSNENVGFIGDAVEIAEVVFELQDDGVCFYLDDEEIIDMVEDNDILQITKLICEDCERVEYHLERVFDDEDYTIYDELDTFYIDSDLIDCIDTDMLDGEIIEIELEIDDEELECDGNCDNCELSEEEFEDEETMGEVLAEELFESLAEVDKDDFETMAELIVDKLQEAYDCAKMDALAELSDTINAINSLR